MRFSWLNEAAYQAFPFPRLWRFNRVLRKADRSERERTWVSLGRDRLLELIGDEWERARSLDDKLSKLTAVLSIAVTVAGAAGQAIPGRFDDGLPRTLSMAMLLYAIGSLFAGALVGFSGLRPKPRYGYGPDFAVKVKRDTRAARVIAADALAQFECMNAIRANESLAAILAIRNGVVAFSLLALAAIMMPERTEQQPAAQSSKAPGATNIGLAPLGLSSSRRGGSQKTGGAEMADDNRLIPPKLDLAECARRTWGDRVCLAPDRVVQLRGSL